MPIDSCPFPPMILHDDFVERHNIAWRGERAQTDHNNPVLWPEYPWDAGATFTHGTALRDPIDGLYKMWHLSTPRFFHDRQLTYACSEDGVNWVKPMLDIYPCDGHEKTNILIGSRMAGQVSQVSVFIHPEAEPDKRYEMFAYLDPRYYKFKTPGYGCESKRLWALDPPEGFDGGSYGLYRLYSGDGLHWMPQAPPVAGDPQTQKAYGDQVLVTSDGLAVFQLRDGRYIMHNKVELPSPPGGYVQHEWVAGLCRTLARRESADGRQWTHPYENILTPDWRDPQDTQFMELMMNEYNHGFIAAVTVFHTQNEEIDLQLAASPDGKKWYRHVRRPAVGLESLGDLAGGMLWPVRGFVIDGDQAHLYYAGLKGLHGVIYGATPQHCAFEGAIFRATWDLGRMWSAISYTGNETTAYLTDKPTAHQGKTLHINAVTTTSGSIKAEMVDDQLKPIPGYTREDCRPVVGDHKCASLTWKAHDTAACEHAMLRIYITDARLYGYDWR